MFDTKCVHDYTERTTYLIGMPNILPFPIKPNRRAFMVGSGAFLGACLNDGIRTASEKSSPDLIVRNANIITNNPNRPYASALSVSGGLIKAVGPDSQITASATSRTQVIDAGGRTLIPGLNDSHQHPTRGGRFYAAELRWDGVDSLARGLDMIRQAAAVSPPGEWVRVIGGWSPFQFKERRLPTPRELTEASPDVPVYVLYLYSQGYLNAAAVRVRGLKPSGQTPPGTGIEFTSDGGAILHAEPNPDLLYGSIGSLPPLSPEVQALSTQHYYRELNRFGLTSVIDAGGGGHKFPVDYSGSQALATSGDLSVRISKYLFPQNKGGELAEFQNWINGYEVGVNRANEIAHGYELEGGGEFLVWSAGDFENFMAARPSLGDRAGWRAELIAVTRLLLRNRWPLRIHATYDESATLILDAFEEAHRLERSEGRQGFSGIRWAMDHGETYSPATLSRIRAMGGGMAVQARMAYAGEYYLDRYGPAATQNAPPLRNILKAGLPLGLGTDGTRVASYNPWPALYWATTGRSVGGTELHGPEQRLTREEALYAYSKGSAWFSQEENVKGALAPGQYADFALLDRPYLDVTDDELMKTSSELTVLGGKVIYASGDFKIAGPEPLPAIKPDWSPLHIFSGYQLSSSQE